MRKVIFEKMKTKISKKDLIEIFKKGINNCTNFGLLRITENEYIAVIINGGLESFSVSASNYRNTDRRIFCARSMDEIVSFDLEEREFFELKRLLEDKKDELYNQVLIKKQKDINILKDYLTR